MLKMTAFLFVVCVASFSFKENPSVSYISQYKEIAISEMLRTGIPASIKMAQALLESGAGQSTLAVKANNHFGIKCGGQWDGPTFYREDDDYNKKGKLIKSCFRKFDSATESFLAHSEFLITQNRYEFLFAYNNTDYRSWAFGLRKAGYATDKKYPQKLIDIIEKYQLYLLDEEIIPDELIAEVQSPKSQMTEDGVSYSDEKELEEGLFMYPGAKLNNVRSGKDSNSSRMGHRTRRIGDSDLTHHVVGQGEKLADIARIHDLDEMGLRLRNRIPKDAEPLAGERIYLRKHISLINRPQFIRYETNNAIAAEDEFIF